MWALPSTVYAEGAKNWTLSACDIICGEMYPLESVSAAAESVVCCTCTYAKGSRCNNLQRSREPSSTVFGRWVHVRYRDKKLERPRDIPVPGGAIETAAVGASTPNTRRLRFCQGSYAGRVCSSTSIAIFPSFAAEYEFCVYSLHDCTHTRPLSRPNTWN